MEFKPRVILHVQSATNSTVIDYLNQVSKDLIDVGGIFHSAIQVLTKDTWMSSVEWAQGSDGVQTSPAGQDPAHSWREFVDLGECTVPEKIAVDILTHIQLEWRGEDYNLVSRNCVTFCRLLADYLGCLANFPTWIDKFSLMGNKIIGNTNDIIQSTYNSQNYKSIHFDFFSTNQSQTNSLDVINLRSKRRLKREGRMRNK